MTLIPPEANIDCSTMGHAQILTWFVINILLRPGHYFYVTKLLPLRSLNKPLEITLIFAVDSAYLLKGGIHSAVVGVGAATTIIKSHDPLTGDNG